MWEVWTNLAWQNWLDREGPSDALQAKVESWMAWLAEQADPGSVCVAVPGKPDQYEAKVPGTNIYVGFFLFRPITSIDVFEIEAG